MLASYEKRQMAAGSGAFSYSFEHTSNSTTNSHICNYQKGNIGCGSSQQTSKYWPVERTNELTAPTPPRRASITSSTYSRSSSYSFRGDQRVSRRASITGPPSQQTSQRQSQNQVDKPYGSNHLPWNAVQGENHPPPRCASPTPKPPAVVSAISQPYVPRSGGGMGYQAPPLVRSASARAPLPTRATENTNSILQRQQSSYMIERSFSPSRRASATATTSNSMQQRQQSSTYMIERNFSPSRRASATATTSQYSYKSQDSTNLCTNNKAQRRASAVAGASASEYVFNKVEMRWEQRASSADNVCILSKKAEQTISRSRPWYLDASSEYRQQSSQRNAKEQIPQPFLLPSSVKDIGQNQMPIKDVGQKQITMSPKIPTMIKDVGQNQMIMSPKLPLVVGNHTTKRMQLDEAEKTLKAKIETMEKHVKQHKSNAKMEELEQKLSELQKTLEEKERLFDIERETLKSKVAKLEASGKSAEKPHSIISVVGDNEKDQSDEKTEQTDLTTLSNKSQISDDEDEDRVKQISEANERAKRCQKQLIGITEKLKVAEANVTLLHENEVRNERTLKERDARIDSLQHDLYQAASRAADAEKKVQQLESVLRREKEDAHATASVQRQREVDELRHLLKNSEDDNERLSSDMGDMEEHLKVTQKAAEQFERERDVALIKVARLEVENRSKKETEEELAGKKLDCANLLTERGKLQNQVKTLTKKLNQTKESNSMNSITTNSDDSMVFKELLHESFSHLQDEFDHSVQTATDLSVRLAESEMTIQSLTEKLRQQQKNQNQQQGSLHVHKQQQQQGLCSQQQHQLARRNSNIC